LLAKKITPAFLLIFSTGGKGMAVHIKKEPHFSLLLIRIKIRIKRNFSIIFGTSLTTVTYGRLEYEQRRKIICTIKKK
jgi:hypothetical protein